MHEYIFLIHCLDFAILVYMNVYLIAGKNVQIFCLKIMMFHVCKKKRWWKNDWSFNTTTALLCVWHVYHNMKSTTHTAQELLFAAQLLAKVVDLWPNDLRSVLDEFKRQWKWVLVTLQWLLSVNMIYKDNDSKFWRWKLYYENLFCMEYWERHNRKTVHVHSHCWIKSAVAKKTYKEKILFWI